MDTREKAMLWWMSLSMKKKLFHFNNNFSSGERTLIGLTGREIELMWRKRHPDTIADSELIEKLKSECKRVKIERNNYEQELIYAHRKISKLTAIIESYKTKIIDL